MIARPGPLLALVGIATLAVHAAPLAAPFLWYDDWAILLQSWTWPAARQNVWVPLNEHCWPLTRLAGYAVARLAGSAADTPLVCGLASRAALLAVVGLVYLFARRERGHPLPGLVAAAVFGVTAVYREGVVWFAAAPGMLAAGTGLLALLAAQRWRQTGQPAALLASAGWAAVAPAWFAGGLLAGPLATVYLLAGSRRWLALVPCVGPTLFLAVSLPLAGDRILHADHYRGETAVQAFGPAAGAVNTGRSLVDNLLLGAVGAGGVARPPAVVVVGLAVLLAVWVWWWQRAVSRRLMLLGTAVVLSHMLVVYSGRAGWRYEVVCGWGRYLVGPQLGLALVVAGGLRVNTPVLTRRQGRAVVALVGGLLVVHLPKGLTVEPTPDPAQMVVLRRVDAVDQLCREHRIAAADAVMVLPRLPLPAGADENAWVFLRGSRDPLPHPPAEVRRLLATECPGPPP